MDIVFAEESRSVADLRSRVKAHPDGPVGNWSGGSEPAAGS